MLTGITAIAQLVFTIIVGMYFFGKLRSEGISGNANSEDARKKAQKLNAMRKISLSEPLSEKARPKKMEEIIGQEDGIKALKAALCGKNPQHVIIYGPPGVGKTAAARIALEEAKKSEGTPFMRNARFIEADATIMRYDERSIADPLIGSVHDPIYQGAGAYGNAGVPEPKEGAVSRAHGGVLFIDEIGELQTMQMNRLLKVLEDRKVIFESAYYSSSNKNIPTYIHDIFKNGLPADFRLIGATTRKPEEIPEAIRSRCVEIFFNELTFNNITEILRNAVNKLGIKADEGVVENIAQYSKSGRDAVKILQTVVNTVILEGRDCAEISDVEWVVKCCRYEKVRRSYTERDEQIIDISVLKPNGQI